MKSVTPKRSTVMSRNKRLEGITACCFPNIACASENPPVVLLFSFYRLDSGRAVTLQVLQNKGPCSEHKWMHKVKKNTGAIYSWADSAGTQ